MQHSTEQQPLPQQCYCNMSRNSGIQVVRKLISLGKTKGMLNLYIEGLKI